MDAPLPKSPPPNPHPVPPTPPEILPIEMLRQPDDVTCGPTCLHAVYRYWDDPVSLHDVIEDVRRLNRDEGERGTLAVVLGLHALKRGYRATLYTFNLHMFDPTWFGTDHVGRPAVLEPKLRAQAEAKGKTDRKLRMSTASYLEFLRKGGTIRYQDLTSRLIAGHIRAGRPVLTGLSATYLYRAVREFGPNDDEDDVQGLPVGHFVVVHGYDPVHRVAHIADPLDSNPAFQSRQYRVSMARLVPAIMLGVLSYDANLLVVEPDTGTNQAEAHP